MSRWLDWCLNLSLKIMVGLLTKRFTDKVLTEIETFVENERVC
jgi:hypothetical protein